MQSLQKEAPHWMPLSTRAILIGKESWSQRMVGGEGGRITVSKVAWFPSQASVDVVTEQAAEVSASVNLEGLINDSYIVCQVHISHNETDCKHRVKSSTQYLPCPEKSGTILWFSPQF